MFRNESEAYAESEAYDSASVVPIHTRSELSSDSDSAYDSASVASVASVNQPLLNRRTATWNLFVLYNKETNYDTKSLLSFKILQHINSKAVLCPFK